MPAAGRVQLPSAPRGSQPWLAGRSAGSASRRVSSIVSKSPRQAQHFAVRPAGWPKAWPTARPTARPTEHAGRQTPAQTASQMPSVQTPGPPPCRPHPPKPRPACLPACRASSPGEQSPANKLRVGAPRKASSPSEGHRGGRGAAQRQAYLGNCAGLRDGFVNMTIARSAGQTGAERRGSSHVPSFARSHQSQSTLRIPKISTASPDITARFGVKYETFSRYVL